MEAVLEQKPKSISLEVAKAEINVALTQQNMFIQKLQDEADALVFNEDNLQAIADFIKKVKKAEGVVADKHEEIKRPFLESGRNCDAAKNAILSSTSVIKNGVSEKYTKLCTDIQKRKDDEAREEQRKRGILQGIENNVIDFSNRIARCETNEELLAIERIINVQKSPSSAGKYGEFHTQAIAKYDEVLKPILKDQKEKVKEKERIAAELKEAERLNDAAKADELKARQEVVNEEIQYNQVKVQEAAINQTPIYVPTYAKEVFPEVKARRTTWEIELVDKKDAIKKAPELLDISLNKEAAKLVLKTLKDSGSLDGKKELILNGIKYYEKVLY